MTTIASHSALTSPTALGVIPARYGSSRFPGKPLVLIQGKPMIQWVWERCKQTQYLQDVVVATDDERIDDCVRGFGGQCLMTNADHPSGSDRIWEVAQQFPQHGIIVNIQGDEPLIEPACIDAVITQLQNTPEAAISTLVTPIHTITDYTDPNSVKAVFDTNSGRALYFSRSPIPYHREPTPESTTSQPLSYRHIGLYAYRRVALQQFVSSPPSPLEQAEKLEQLRALELGLAIYTQVIPEAPVGIDTPADLAALEARLSHLMRTP